MFKKTLLFFLCFSLFLSISGCKGTPTGPDIPTILLPEIGHFNALPTSIDFGSGSIVSLSWATTSATLVTIDQGIGTVPTSGLMDVSPEDTTIYTLTAKNNDGQKTASCTVEVIARAVFELGAYDLGYTNYGSCEITGIVKNVGNATGYNVCIEFQAYAFGIIIDTARGFPASLGNIPIGISASFEAIFFDIYDWADITSTTYEITWLTAQGTVLIQTGMVPFK